MNQNRPILTKRQQKRQLKYKNQLLCENCNRYGVVSYEKWRDLKDTEYVWFCNRERCIKSRSETLWTPRPDGETKKEYKGRKHKD